MKGEKKVAEKVATAGVIGNRDVLRADQGSHTGSLTGDRVEICLSAGMQQKRPQNPFM